MKALKRLTVGIVLSAIALAIGYQLLMLAITALKFGEPPSWTWGVGKFSRFKNVVGYLQCYELASLLRTDQPKAFNRPLKDQT